MSAPLQSIEARPLPVPGTLPQFAMGDRLEVRFDSDAALRRGLALALEQCWISECVVDVAGRALVLRMSPGAVRPTRVLAPSVPETSWLH
jgi:hypothetical protein